MNSRQVYSVEGADAVIQSNSRPPWRGLPPAVQLMGRDGGTAEGCRGLTAYKATGIIANRTSAVSGVDKCPRPVVSSAKMTSPGPTSRHWPSLVVMATRPEIPILWLLNEHNSAARERAGYQEWGNTVYNTCQGPLQLDILKPRGSIVPRVNPQVSHAVTSDRICLSHSASLQSGGSGPSRREVYAIFEDYGAVGEWSATRKLSKNGVVGARSEGRWELSGFPTLTQWRKGCRKKRSASRAESRRTGSVGSAGASSPRRAGRSGCATK